MMASKRSLASLVVFLACCQQLAQPVHRQQVVIDNGKQFFEQ